MRSTQLWASFFFLFGAVGLASACGSGSSDRKVEGDGTGGSAGSGSSSGSGGGLICTDGDCQKPDPGTPPPCGDGVLTEDKVCDDGNREDGDGCAGDCLSVEAGWSCPTPGEACIRIAICGDGIVSFPELCDDGDTDSGDGCSPNCKLELGYKCSGEPSTCTETTCGDNKKEGAEACDDGNVMPFDGCSPTCQREPQCPNVGPCEAECGDGIVMGNEECDDGNTTTGDGCSSKCTEEDGYECSLLSELGDTMRVPIVYRDMKSKSLTGGHEDFHTGGSCMGDYTAPYLGIVNSTLDADRKPTFAVSDGSCFIQSQTTFSTWFRDSDKSKTFSEFLELTRDGEKYGFDPEYFFPVDGRGWVAEATDPEPTYNGPDGEPHNYLFTSEVKYWFEYNPKLNAELFFRGDDDVWVFVGGRLAVDLGGTHTPATGSFILDEETGTNLELEVGRVYEVSVFHAERNPTGSSYRLELSGFNPSPSDCEATCGDGIIGLGEECDDGAANNTGGYGKCGPECKLTQYCGDGVVQDGEDCDEGPNNGKSGACPAGCRRVVVR